MREVVSEAENPVMLYSIGKDSAVMLHIAKKAFFPSHLPFPLLHVDTTWKFREMYKLRDKVARDEGLKLIVHQNSEAKEKGINPFDNGAIHTDLWKTEGLKQAPKSQRPELWNIYNTRKVKNESIRVFPLSNWTELDIWQYIYLEGIEIVPLYFAAKRPTVIRNELILMVDDERFPLRKDETPVMRSIRFRTLGCYPLTGAIISKAVTLKEVIQETLLTKTSERQGRAIDKDSGYSMEIKKQHGYF